MCVCSSLLQTQSQCQVYICKEQLLSQTERNKQTSLPDKTLFLLLYRRQNMSRHDISDNLETVLDAQIHLALLVRCFESFQEDIVPVSLFLLPVMSTNGTFQPSTNCCWVTASSPAPLIPVSFSLHLISGFHLDSLLSLVHSLGGRKRLSIIHRLSEPIFQHQPLLLLQPDCHS